MCSSPKPEVKCSVHGKCRVFCTKNPTLSKLIKIIPSTKRMVYQPTGSIYQVLSSEVATKHERALQQASDKLQECYTRQNDYAQRLADAKDKQQQLKTEVASAAQAYRHYKNTLGETDSATIAAKANLDAYKGEYRAAVQERLQEQLYQGRGVAAQGIRPARLGMEGRGRL